MRISKKSSKRKVRAAPGDAGHREFVESLNNALASNPTVSTGRVHLIGLEKIREMLGDEWDRLKDKAHHIARSAIKDRLSARDMYTLYEDLSYLVVFADLSKEEAQLKCSLIAEEISNRLIGSKKALDFSDVSTLALKKNGNLYFKEIPSIKSLASQLEEVSRVEKQEAAITIVEPHTPHEIDWSTIQLIFRPLWLVRGEIVSTFLCVPVAMQENGFYANGYSVLPDPEDRKAITDLDVHMLQGMAWEISRLGAQGKKALLSVPVHFETLAGLQTRIEYTKLCSSLLENHKDRIVFELVELPEGIPQGRILELVSALRPHARAVTARFSLDHTNFAAYRIAGLHAVGVDIYAEKRSEAEIMKRMDRFVELANKNALKTVIHGVRTLSLKTAAVTSGFDYIDGYALTSVAEVPEGAYALGLEASYRPLFNWVETKEKLAEVLERETAEPGSEIAEPESETAEPGSETAEPGSKFVSKEDLIALLGAMPADSGSVDSARNEADVPDVEKP